MRREIEGLEIASVDLSKFDDSLVNTEEVTYDLSGFVPIEITDEITVTVESAL